MLIQFLYFLIMSFVFSKDINHYPISCSEHCPDYVVGVWNDENKICTGALVAPNIVATNLHCLPKRLQIERASCAGAVFFSFPKTEENSEEVIECDQVLHVAPPIQDPALSLDYAFLYLKKATSRKPIRMDTSGIEDNEMVTLFKIDPEDNGKRGVIHRDQCQAIQKSMFNPLFTSQESPIVSLIPCAIIQGNSGASMVSSNGFLKGMINSTLSPSESFGSDRNIPAANGTSLTCVDIPELEIRRKAPFSLCKASPLPIEIKKAGTNLLAAELKKAQDLFNKELETQRKKLNERSQKVFVWKAQEVSHPFDMNSKSQSAVREVTYIPQCISLSQSLVKQKAMSLKKEDVLLKVEISKISLYFQMDAVGRFKGHTILSKKTSEFRLKPTDLLKEKVPLVWDAAEILLPHCLGN